jgi:O-glycosyl hydrolase
MKQKLILLVCIVWVVNCLFGQVVTFTIDKSQTAQTIENIGASGAWFSEGIGKYWPDSVKNRMAELLFSKAFDKKRYPLGIGLSAWRFNIGGGTAEQGDSSGISNPVKRVECFLSPDGRYDWSKQSGYMWFVKKAKEYGVENLILFSNTPPVQFTKNGLGFKTEKDYTANLRDDKYVDYADFLATVVQHFDKEGLHFNYISPVNEPQWDWSSKWGKMNQEGSPWHNKDIYKITETLDSVLSAKKLSSKIIIAEAGILTALYSGQGPASKQIQHFYSPDSSFYLGNLRHLKHIIEGHSYFTDNGDSNTVTIRSKLRDTAAKYKVPFWESEYSMLGDGYKEGKAGKISAMDCALFLAKMIYNDLTVANATAWHLWNAWEPGNAVWDTRYYMLALQNNAANTSGSFIITKNLWALGHFSRFVRPGMKRIVVERSDGLNDIQAAKDIMLSAFTNHKQLVIVTINYTNTDKVINLNGIGKFRKVKQYITTANEEDNMKPEPISSVHDIKLQPRSIATIIVDL